MIEDPQAGKLLVVDADPALGLHYALGRKEIKTIGTVRDEILRVAEEGDRQAQEELADKVDYLTARVLDEGKDFSFWPWAIWNPKAVSARLMICSSRPSVT